MLKVLYLIFGEPKQQQQLVSGAPERPSYVCAFVHARPTFPALLFGVLNETTPMIYNGAVRALSHSILRPQVSSLSGQK